MERPLKGDVVVANFTNSDLSESKKRPALVVAELDGSDLILCQITSQLKNDIYSIDLKEKDFTNGRLEHQICKIRPNRLFTAEEKVILYKIGSISKQKQAQVEDTIIA